MFSPLCVPDEPDPQMTMFDLHWRNDGGIEPGNFDFAQLAQQ